MTLLDEEVVEAYALASLRWSGTTGWRGDAAVAAAGLRVWTKAVGDGLDHLPFFLALDVRTLVSGHARVQYPDESLADVDVLLRARYENEAIGRLLRHRPFGRARELVDFHDTDDDPRRADRLAQIILTALAPCWPRFVQVNAAHVRRLRIGAAAPPAESAVEDGAALWLDWLNRNALTGAEDAAVATLVDAVRGTNPGGPRLDWTRLIQNRDLFELDHLPALDREYLRLGVRQILEVLDDIPALDPHEVRLNEEESEAETQFTDQSHYPTGGFSELTTRGSFENLVLSELIYMGEGDAGIDLFDLRYVEGELLYYSRDSGELRRKRRRAVLVVDLATALDLRLPGHDHQLVVMVAGMLLALVRDLSLLFFRDSLLFQIQLIPGDATDSAARLNDILEILLAGPIQHRLLEVRMEARPEAWLEAGSNTRKTYAVLLSAGSDQLTAWAADAATSGLAAQPVFATVVDLLGERHLTPTGLVLERNSEGLVKLHRSVLESIMNGRATVAS